MRAKSDEIQDVHLLTYAVASSDMRYIEINRREIHLRHDPELGLILRGVVPECGPDCDATLGELLLEYAMGCEDCRDRVTAAAAADHFGRHLGQALASSLYQQAPDLPAKERLIEAFAITLNSMNVSFELVRLPDRLEYTLAHCPLHEAAQKLGLNLWVATAHRAFVSLGHSLLQKLAADWQLVQPADSETDAPLLAITLAKVH